MIKKIFWVFILSPFVLFGQDKGITFQQNSSLESILQKAKSENKYVFVDCYATWCGPCKEMDKMVYNDDTVGTWMNRHFISVKIQMNITKHDSPEIQKWYPVARQFEKTYRIDGYPSFIFIAPDGQVVDKKMGATNTKGFIEITKKAMDPATQYYVLLSRYEKSKIDFTQMANLALMAKELGEDSLALAIAPKYINRYLTKLSSKQLWTKENIDFLSAFKDCLKTHDVIFRKYFKHRKDIDDIMNDSMQAERFICKVIYNDKVLLTVNEDIKMHKEPDWNKINCFIERHYGAAYAEKNIVAGRVVYYRSEKKWQQYARFFVLWMQQADILTWTPSQSTMNLINDDAFEVFKYSNNKDELEAALSWQERAMTMTDHPIAALLDTKANILYRLGRIEEGLKIEAQSANLAPNDQDIQSAYSKMKSGQPTWPME
jgi:thiol-disulfide isomerase/thioredoxin